MAKAGRPRKDVEHRQCPRPGHQSRPVVLAGRIRRADGTVTHQRFICGYRTKEPHGFRVRLVAAGGSPKRQLQPPRPSVPPPSCPDHLGGHVIRFGSYKAGGTRRQRYLCTPPRWQPGAKRAADPNHARHVFTPDLPRAHVKGDATCPHCAELRAIHRGETAAARKHSANTATVAEALRRLAAGGSYAKVSLWLQGKVRPKDEVPPRISAKAKNAWRRAADVVEIFAPVLWADWQRTVAVEDVAQTQCVEPRVIMVDDVPLFVRAQRGRSRQAQRFAVLTCGEVVQPTTPGTSSRLRVRLMRAFPSHSANAYKLLLAETGIVPDFVLADGGKGIRPAVVRHAQRVGEDITFITSHYHLRLQLGRALDKAEEGCERFDASSLRESLDTFAPFASRVAFEQWWQEFERHLDAQRVPRHARSDRWKNEYYSYVCAELDALATFPHTAKSTGALETRVGGQFKATLEARSGAFGNLARTNALLDLFVLYDNGYFDDMPHVIRVLRADATHGDPEHPGFVPPVRQICDAGAYRSLLDPERVEALAVTAGVL